MNREGASKPKVLFVITKPILGGAQRWTLDQIRLFADEFDMTLACASSGWLSDEASGYVQEVVIFEALSNPLNLLAYYRFYRYLRNGGFDLVVASSAYAGLYSRIASWLADIPNIYVSHGWSALYRGGSITRALFAGVERRLSAITTRILAVSPSDYIQARDLIRIAAEKIVMIENGIFPPSQIAEASFPPFNIVMVARFDHPKRQDLLIEAIQGMSEVELTLVGDGPSYETMRNRYPSSNIRFLGAQQEIYPILLHSHAFALISEHEGLPISVLEALSAGLPLILSNIPSHQIFLSHNGVLVDNTVESIRQGIESLKRMDLNALSLHSRNLFDERFNLSNNHEKYRKLYTEIIRNRLIT